MAIVTTDDRHYKAIAAAIREQMASAGVNETMRPVEMPGWIDDACALARAESERNCAAKHYLQNFVGDGSGAHSFHVPFEPDMVLIMGFDPLVLYTEGNLAVVRCDIRAFGLLGGFTQYAVGNGAISNTAYATNTVPTRCFRAEDGTITVKNIGPSGTPVQYGAGILYTAIAVKYTERTDKELITDFVHRLTGSGKTTLNRTKVNEVFTDDEWAALIAVKPNWTFSWI